MATHPARVVGAVRIEHGEAFGLGTGAPRLSWQLAADDPSFRPRAYELELAVPGRPGQRVHVDSPDQVLVPWPFPPLGSRDRATVRVRVGDGTAWTPWSVPSALEVGLLRPDDWSARFITPRGLGGIGHPAPTLHRLVRLRAAAGRARLYVTAHGLYRALINGLPVGDDVLAPGWTSYPHRLRYRTYDVTDRLYAGENALAVTLGNGWYRGRLGFDGRRAHYGDRLALLAQLEVAYADGGIERFVTDGSWGAHESPILADDLYDGQHTDLRRPALGGPRAAVDVLDTDEGDLGRLVAPEGRPVRVTGAVPAIELVVREPGRVVVDFGQNVVGWVRVRLRATAPGDRVTVRHAEVLERGELARRPLRTAQATDSYVLAGGAHEVLEPTFTVHGFRYAEIGGGDALTARLTAADVEAVVVGSDLVRTGWFACSDADVDRLHENVVWSARGNLVDVLTDCPQRDERLGWTGDTQVIAPTACFLYDCAGLLTSWLADLRHEQQPGGTVPLVVPDVLGLASPVAGWGDAATIVPSVLHERYGDSGVVEQQFASMRAWVDAQAGERAADGTWSGGFQLGDWLDPSAPPSAPWAARADPTVVATAHLARSADLVAAAATRLGRTEHAERYAKLADEVRRAFADHFVTPGGRVLSDCPTVYALALVWDLLPGPGQREAAGRRLADLVRAAGFHVATGFLGTPVVADALCRAGETEVAYRLLLQRDCPSWLYPVTMGATTVWERWDSLLPGGSVNPGEMTSFNHCALGAVADWLHRCVAGLAPAAAGYREVLVRPLVARALTWAEARHLSPYGEIAVGWHRADGRLRLDVRLPVGVTATVHVPGAAGVDLVDHGRHVWETEDPVGSAPRLPADPTLREVLDVPALCDEVTGMLTDCGVARDRVAAAGLLLSHLDTRVSALPAPLAPAALLAGVPDAGERVAALVHGYTSHGR